MDLIVDFYRHSEFSILDQWSRRMCYFSTLTVHLLYQTLFARFTVPRYIANVLSIVNVSRKGDCGFLPLKKD